MNLIDLIDNTNHLNKCFPIFVVSPAFCRGDYGQQIVSYDIGRRMKDGSIFTTWRDAEKFGIEANEWDNADEVLILIPQLSEKDV